MTARIITFGCRLNTVESETIRDHTACLPHAPGAGTIIVNTCAVTAEAERQARQAIRRAHRDNPGAAIVVTGCAAQIAPSAWADLPGVTRVVGNREKLLPETWTPEAQSPRSPGPQRLDPAPPDPAPPDPGRPDPGRPDRARAYLQIQQGCDHRCTFCIIPFGRGPSRSLPLGDLAARLRAQVEAGFAEVVLTGVDLTSYGADLPGTPSLGQAVRRLLAAVPELPRLRLSSLDPAEIDPDLWTLIGNEPRLMPHLHLSLQSASDLILKRMKRRHSAAQAADAIARARALRPGIAIGADLIAGFPTETDELAQQTLDFVQAHALPYLHVFPYSERPGTPAARMPPVPLPVRRHRAAQLRQAGQANAAAYFAGLIGTPTEVLAEGRGRGHTSQFAPVAIDAPSGERVRATIIGASSTGVTITPYGVPAHLAGQVAGHARAARP